MLLCFGYEKSHPGCRVAWLIALILWLFVVWFLCECLEGDALVSGDGSDMVGVVSSVEEKASELISGVPEFIHGLFLAIPGSGPGLKEFGDDDCADTAEGDLQDGSDEWFHSPPLYRFLARWGAVFS